MSEHSRKALVFGSRSGGAYVKLDEHLNVVESHSPDLEAAVLSIVAATRDLMLTDCHANGDPLALASVLAEESGLASQFELSENLSLQFWLHTYLHWLEAARSLQDGVDAQTEYELHALAAMNSMYSMIEAAFFEVADETLNNELLADDIARSSSTLAKWEVLAHALSRKLPRDKDTRRQHDRVQDFLSRRNQTVHVPLRIKKKREPGTMLMEILTPQLEEVSAWFQSCVLLVNSYATALGSSIMLKDPPGSADR